ncbi:MAG TPA: VWA domain-containing protein [Myxococcota bacterium]|nr:VWA domain-containing protein [Myxococcota bacterium]
MWQTFALSALSARAITFESPLVLWLALLLVALLAALAAARGPRRLRVPTAGGGRAGAALAALDLPWASSLALRVGALALVGVTAARPVGLVAENPVSGSGVDLVIALDASGSMLALDGELEGRQVTRIALAKRVVADFVRARAGDRIGLVVFGEHAFTQCPLTVDHRLVLEALERVEVGVAGDATAVGEAIGLATRRLRSTAGPEETRRVVVLVTDGRHNSGKLAPKTAAELAQGEGVRIHAVGIGSEGLVPFAQPGAEAPMRFERVDLDRETLQAVASATGGRFFHARHPEDLRAVADAIDRLEARPRQQDPQFRHASLAPLTLAAALFLLLAEALLTHGILRRLP